MYFFSGAFAIVAHQWWLMETYGNLRSSGMLAWIIIVGFITQFLSPQGFIGVDSIDKKSVNRFSLLLLFVSICAFGMSFVLRGNGVVIVNVPFIFLFLTQYYLRKRIIGNNKKQNESVQKAQ